MSQMWRSLTRQIGARYAISLGLIVLVALVIGVARLLPHRPADQLVVTDPPLSAGPVASGGPATAPVPSGGAATAPATSSSPLLHSPVPPVTAPGRKTPQQVATLFAKAWVKHDVSAATWQHALAPYATAALAARLTTTDPANVPAARVTGDPTVVDDAADRCDVRIATDAGTLVLGLAGPGGAWLVDTVDWDRS